MQNESHCPSLFATAYSLVDKREANTSPRADENVVCERCGRFGALEFTGTKLCADCYQQAGSCCPEFNEDDLRETPPS